MATHDDDRDPTLAAWKRLSIDLMLLMIIGGSSVLVLGLLWPRLEPYLPAKAKVIQTPEPRSASWIGKVKERAAEVCGVGRNLEKLSPELHNMAILNCEYGFLAGFVEGLKDR